jgi:hypothetical protein
MTFIMMAFSKIIQHYDTQHSILKTQPAKDTCFSALLC